MVEKKVSLFRSLDKFIARAWKPAIQALGPGAQVDIRLSDATFRLSKGWELNVESYELRSLNSNSPPGTATEAEIELVFPEEQVPYLLASKDFADYRRRIKVCVQRCNPIRLRIVHRDKLSWARFLTTYFLFLHRVEVLK